MSGPTLSLPDKPIEVPRSAAWDLIWQAVRTAMIVTSTVLVVLVYVREGIGSAVGAGAMLVGALPGAIAYAAGAVKWLRNHREKRVMAAAAPDDVAVTT